MRDCVIHRSARDGTTGRGEGRGLELPFVPFPEPLIPSLALVCHWPFDTLSLQLCLHAKVPVRT